MGIASKYLHYSMHKSELYAIKICNCKCIKHINSNIYLLCELQEKIVQIPERPNEKKNANQTPDFVR